MTHLTIRPAVLEDADEILPMLKAMHDESRYKDTNYDESICSFNLKSFIENPSYCVFVSVTTTGDISGIIMGVLYPNWWGTGVSACDILLYVKPEHRNRDASSSLVCSYTEWARSHKVPDNYILIGVSSELNTEKTVALYKSLGYVDSAVVLRQDNGNGSK